MSGDKFDDPIESPPAKVSGTITVTFTGGERGKPLDYEDEPDPRDEALSVAEKALRAIMHVAYPYLSRTYANASYHTAKDALAAIRAVGEGK